MRQAVEVDPRKGGRRAFDQGRAGRLMFLLSLNYIAPLAEIDAAMSDHVSWLNRGHTAGSFLAWGRKVPRTGGIILARGGRAEVEAVAQTESLRRARPGDGGGCRVLAQLRRRRSRSDHRMTIALIDFRAGNLHSVHNALKAAGADDVAVTADPEVVAAADRIVLPGVGAFAACRTALFGIEGMAEGAEPARAWRRGCRFSAFAWACR